jgi:hypothetical protein
MLRPFVAQRVAPTCCNVKCNEELMFLCRHHSLLTAAVLQAFVIYFSASYSIVGAERASVFVVYWLGGRVKTS